MDEFAMNLRKSTNYPFHHQATTPGYISKKEYPQGKVEAYSGRFGKGYVILTHNNLSTKYCNIEYYIEETNDAKTKNDQH